MKSDRKNNHLSNMASNMNGWRNANASSTIVIGKTEEGFFGLQDSIFVTEKSINM